LNDNWSAGFWDKTDGHVEMIAAQDGLGYAQIDIRGRDVPLYIGNLLVCDNPAVRLDLVLDREAPLIQAHNPTTAPIECVIRSPEGFKAKMSFSKKVTLSPGALLKIPIPPECLASP
jgi:hypothetical protein